jgi:hypothetical protein
VIDRTALLADLQQLVGDLEDDLRNRCTDVPDIDAVGRAQWLRAESAGRTAQSYETWREGWITQAAVAWVLACVFVRFCEDNGLVDDPLLSGAGDRRAIAQDHRQLHLRQHHADSDRECLLAVFDRYRHLPGLGEILGAHNPLWELAPTADGARLLVEFWWKINPETGALVHDFTDPSWDTRFLGDLYQDLSESARKAYALLQTPDFIEEFILDRTLDPAVDEYGLENASMIDPTCGSGHFLLGAFGRLFERWLERAPGDNRRALAQRALDAVHGVDVNPFAVGIARFRLLVAALKASRVDRLAGAPDFVTHVATGDSLLHGVQTGQLTGTDTHHLAVHHSYASEDLDQARAILSDRYNAVVGNPPYITPKDPALNDVYRRLYSTCHRQYSLGVPFTERFFDLADAGGFVGMITANSFMKREFGKKLIEDYFPTVDLTHVIDTSGAYIPGHGTPTVILFGRHQKPVGLTIRMVMGIRGEPERPSDPSRGLVWTSIATSVDVPGSVTDFISVADLERERLARHPWSIGGGGAADLKVEIGRGRPILRSFVRLIGYTGQTNADDAFLAPRADHERHGVEQSQLRQLVVGDVVRDWSLGESDHAVFPYSTTGLCDLDAVPGTRRRLWPLRTLLWARATFSKRTYREEGRTWWEWHQVALDRLPPPAICFAFVASHNHFVLDRAGRAFNRSAPIIKLDVDASEDAHLRLLAPLNSSTACFWMKQVFHDKGNRGTGGGIVDEAWERFFEFDGTKMQDFPVPADPPTPLARRLDLLARERAESMPASLVERDVPLASVLDAARERSTELFEQMVTTQEELDWACYHAYGLLNEVPSASVDNTPPLRLGERAFEIVLARRIASGAERSSWFERNRAVAVTEVPGHWPDAYRRVVERRIELIESDPSIALIERAEYKRRWLTEPWEAQQQRALRRWLLDRLESDRYWPEPRVTTCARLAEGARVDANFMQVAALYAGQDFDLVRLIVDLVTEEAVSYLAAYRYKEPGLRKRAEWERTWELQRAEDEIDARTSLPADDPRYLTADQADVLKRQEVGTIPVPPKYASSDFVKTTYWRHRGKLDVPKERFISYPGAERENDPTLVVGWAGWDHLQRAQALSAWFTEARDSGTDRARLVPMLAGLWELIPWLRQWHNEIDPTFGERLGDFFASFTTEQAGALGHTTDELAAWRPPAPTRGRRAPA